LQTVAGPNELFNGLNNHIDLVRVPRSGSLKADLISLFSTCGSTAPDADIGYQDEYTNKPVTNKDLLVDHVNSIEVDERLAKIWANNKIDFEVRNQGYSFEAVKLAQEFQIVSPVSSAIVVEKPTVPQPIKVVAPKYSLANVLPGSTNGSQRMEKKHDSFASSREEAGAPVAATSNAKDAEEVAIGIDATASDDEGKPVPEADTWLLLALIAILLPTWLLKRRQLRCDRSAI